MTTFLEKKVSNRVNLHSFHRIANNKNQRDSGKSFNSSTIIGAVTVWGCRRGIIGKKMQYLFVRLTNTTTKPWNILDKEQIVQKKNKPETPPKPEMQ